VLGLTASEVQGFGRKGGRSETFRGVRVPDRVVPKVEVLVSPEDVEKIMDTIAEAAGTSKIGDGKIWAIEVDPAMRVRTGELGLDVL